MIICYILIIKKTSFVTSPRLLHFYNIYTHDFEPKFELCSSSSSAGTFIFLWTNYSLPMSLHTNIVGDFSPFCYKLTIFFWITRVSSQIIFVLGFMGPSLCLNSIKLIFKWAGASCIRKLVSLQITKKRTIFEFEGLIWRKFTFALANGINT